MGVPSFYRWLSDKYPRVVADVIEEKFAPVDGYDVPIDASQPNPNHIEFDNLYLDMNGLVHPCCHPEHGPLPSDESEMFRNVFAYIDRIFNIVRPRKLVYMALDGVAPRAKMNQQRSRRFRAAKESSERYEKEMEIRNEFEKKGIQLPSPKPKAWDHNVITPGTEFMHDLSEALQWYIHQRVTTNPAWKDLQVILSDSNIPGEGEHKVIKYIRLQRCQPEYDPNLRHVMYGMDADLIMLGLVTHEANFSIIREVVKFGRDRGCHSCGKQGHNAAECTAKDDPEFVLPEQPFQFLHLDVLREYLGRELVVHQLPFPWDTENAIDDFVFLCFFVGNDFLPHLPSLEIREGALDDLIILYKKLLPQFGGYICNKGNVNLERANLLLSEIGKLEDRVFRKRVTEDERRKQRQERDKRMREAQSVKRRTRQGDVEVVGGIYSTSGVYSEDANADMALKMRKRMRSQDQTNDQQREVKKKKLTADSSVPEEKEIPIDFDKFLKDELKKMSEVNAEDEIKLGVGDDWKLKYYKKNFQFTIRDIRDRTDGLKHLLKTYVEGLCWVMLYYYDGCPSWSWYFPYHYAPLASDLYGIDEFKIEFELSAPFTPLAQLMAVLPGRSGHCIPECYRSLMTDDNSPIKDIYPEDFEVDLNGKRFTWQGVVLLPFLDESRLLNALESKKHLLDAKALRRDTPSYPEILFHRDHPMSTLSLSMYRKASEFESFEPWNLKEELMGYESRGVFGFIAPNPEFEGVGSTISAECAQVPPFRNTRTLDCYFADPPYAPHICRLLSGAYPREPVLTDADMQRVESTKRYGGRSILRMSQIAFDRRQRGRKREAYSQSQQYPGQNDHQFSRRHGRDNRDQRHYYHAPQRGYQGGHRYPSQQGNYHNYGNNSQRPRRDDRSFRDRYGQHFDNPQQRNDQHGAPDYYDRYDRDDHPRHPHRGQGHHNRGRHSGRDNRRRY